MSMPFMIMQRRRRVAKIIVVSVAAISLLLIIDSGLRPMIKQIAANRARLLSIQAINEAVTQVLSDERFTFDQLVTVAELENGEISSVKTDIVKINALKSEINAAIQRKMTENNYAVMGIPVGSLTGSEVLNGRGPKIKIKVNLHGNVFTDLNSQFCQAGINQTLHQLMLNVKTAIFVEFPGYNTTTDVETNFCIAETVIVGRVPESYTNVNGDNSSQISKINDYADN